MNYPEFREGNKELTEGRVKIRRNMFPRKKQKTESKQNSRSIGTKECSDYKVSLPQRKATSSHFLVIF